MTIRLLTKTELAAINRKNSRFDLATAEKIRAASGRARYRDFYDMVLLDRKYNFDMKHIEELIRHKEVRYPIGGKRALKNLDTALKEFQKERSNIYYSEQVSKEEILELLGEMDFDIS